MKFTDEDLATQDIDWFSVDNKGHIGHFATGGQGFVPLSVISSIENNDILLDYFFALEKTSQIQIIEKNLPDFANNDEKNRYLESFIEFGSRGLYSFDINDSGNKDEYVLIVKPQNPLTINDLPVGIKEILMLTKLTNDEFRKLDKIKKSLFDF